MIKAIAIERTFDITAVKTQISQITRKRKEQDGEEGEEKKKDTIRPDNIRHHA